MAAWVTPVSVLRVPARMELWNWVTRSVPLSFVRNSAISTPYAETTPMVALREYPVPKTRLDTSIFEVSEENEYRSVAESFKHSVTATTPVATNSSGFSSSSLLQLVRQRDYASASRVRAEMIQHNLPITPNHAFIFPAIRAFRDIADPAVRLREFSGWLSLLPAAKNSQPRFGHLVHMLSSNPQVNIDLVMAFTLMCVSKGYVVKIPDQMIPLVIQFTPPSVSLQFVEDLGSVAIQEFALNQRIKRKIRFWCRIAMVEYVRIGLAEEATKIAQIALQYVPSLPRDPSRWVKKAIANHPDHLGISEEIGAALTYPKPRLTYGEMLLRRRGLKSETPSALSPFGLDTDPSDQEALLSRVWESTRTMEPPDALDIARFLETFDSQPTIIQSLSTHNQNNPNKPPRYRSRWILGEMLYYARRKEWRELIGAFDAYFFRVGVPGNIDKHKLRGRVTPLPVWQRLFPSPYHTSLVWMAAVELARKARPISALFKEMVDQATAAKTRNHAQAGPPQVSARMFDAGHFGPFLVAAYRDQRFKHLVAAVSEMSRLGIEPTLEQLSLLAGAYAGGGEGHEAVRILDRIEGVLKEGRIKRSSRGHHSVPPIVAFYLPALKWFIVRKDTPGASLVRSRILGQGYVRGTHPYLDRKLAKIETPTAVCNR